MLNILDIIFLSLAFMITITGSLINNYENYVPAFIIKSFRYGSFAYKGSEATCLQMIEIPKSYYRHFYIFSSIFSISALIYMSYAYFLGANVGNFIIVLLRLLLEVEHPSVCATGALVAMFLMTMQCLKRLYETQLIQVFSKSGRMNINHYIVGYLHYFGCVIAIIGQAPLFTVASSNLNKIKWLDTYTSILLTPCLLVYLWACYEQYKTNIIFTNLRCDKKSKQLITEDHSVPYGRLFSKVSSPHRLCEVLMYTALLILIPTKTFFCIYLWVIANQTQTAIHAHEWYKANFKSYPKDRMALIPNYL